LEAASSSGAMKAAVPVYDYGTSLEKGPQWAANGPKKGFKTGKVPRRYPVGLRTAIKTFKKNRKGIPVRFWAPKKAPKRNRNLSQLRSGPEKVSQ
jgi:hypothetical protein